MTTRAEGDRYLYQTNNPNWREPRVNGEDVVTYLVYKLVSMHCGSHNGWPKGTA